MFATIKEIFSRRYVCDFGFSRKQNEYIQRIKIVGAIASLEGISELKTRI